MVEKLAGRSVAAMVLGAAALVFVVSMLAAPQSEATVVFSDDFSTNPNSNPCWKVFRNLGSAATEAVWSPAGYLRLTTPNAWSTSVVVPCKDLPSGAWTVTYQYYVDSGDGADGIAFMFNKDFSYLPATGTGWSMGVSDRSAAPYRMGYAVVVDNYYDAVSSDPSAPTYIGTVGGDLRAHRSSAYPFPQAEDGQWHTVVVDHCQAGLVVRVDGTQVLTDSGPFLDNFLQFGFSASNGIDVHEQRIDNIVVDDCNSPSPAPPVPATTRCSQVETGIQSAAMRPFFDGQAMPPGEYTAHYVGGAMRYDFAMRPNDWSIHGAYGKSIFLTDTAGYRHAPMPGDSVKYASQSATEGAVTNAASRYSFFWPGGVMNLRVQDDDYSGNVGGSIAPTFRICIPANPVEAVACPGILFSDSFETYTPGTRTRFVANTTHIAWRVAGTGSPSVDIYPYSGWTPSDPSPTSFGTRYLDLQGSTGADGTLELLRTFPVVAGNRYTLTWSMSGSLRGSGPEQVSVTFAGTGGGSWAGGSFTVPDTMPWTTYTGSFVATANGNLTLSMRNAGTDSQGALIDNVQVSCVLPDLSPSAVIRVGPQSCGDALVRVDGPASSSPVGSALFYAWDWGDGNTSATALATHAYDVAGIYAVALTVTDAEGREGRAVWMLNYAPVTCPVPVPQPERGPSLPYPEEPWQMPPRTNAPPWAAIAIELDCDGRTASFDGLASGDADGTVVSWTWSFEDGAESIGPQATHAFAGPGPFTVQLRVEDDTGFGATRRGIVDFTTCTAPPAAPKQPWVAAVPNPAKEAPQAPPAATITKPPQEPAPATTVVPEAGLAANKSVPASQNPGGSPALPLAVEADAWTPNPWWFLAAVPAVTLLVFVLVLARKP